MTEDSKSAWRYRPAWICDEALRLAWTCYDHLVGRLGVTLAERLGARGYVQLHDDEAGQVGEEGVRFFAEPGLDIVGAAGRQRRVPIIPRIKP